MRTFTCWDSASIGAQSLLTQYEKTCGHPNNSDIEHLRVFLSDNLTE
jgi:hypothetical protein